MSVIIICVFIVIDCSVIVIFIGVVEIFLIVFVWIFGITFVYDCIIYVIL